MRPLRLIFRASALLGIGLGLVIVVVILSNREIPALYAIAGIPMVVFGGLEWFLWPALFPRGLKADAMEVTYIAQFDPKHMPRVDVALIFRGQVLEHHRGGGSWQKNYIFAAPDGKVGMSCNAISFTDEGMTEFAQRLQVPIRGDFSVRVKDRVDPAPA